MTHERKFQSDSGDASATPPPPASAEPAISDLVLPPAIVDLRQLPRADFAGSSDEAGEAPNEPVAEFPWDFERTFPPPLPNAIGTGTPGMADAAAAHEVAALHREHGRQYLAVLHELDRVAAAQQSGTITRTGRRLRSPTAGERLQHDLHERALRLCQAADALLAAYENAFGDAAAGAFRRHLEMKRGCDATWPVSSPPSARTLAPVIALPKRPSDCGLHTERERAATSDPLLARAGRQLLRPRPSPKDASRAPAIPLSRKRTGPPRLARRGDQASARRPGTAVAVISDGTPDRETKESPIMREARNRDDATSNRWTSAAPKTIPGGERAERTPGAQGTHRVVPAVANTRPTSTLDPVLHLAIRVLLAFEKGAFCPAEMWAQLTDVLSRGDAWQILDGLPEELQVILRESYRERPLSFSALRGHPLRRQVTAWLRNAADRRQGPE